MQALDVFGLPGDSVLAAARRPGTDRGRAGRVARDRYARRLGRGVHAPHELESPQPGPPPGAPAGRARHPRDVARDDRRGGARRPARRVRAAPLRWQGRPDGSTFGLPEGQRFQRAALPRLAADGRFAMLTLRLDGRPIAFHCWFVAGTRSTCTAMRSTPACRATGLGSSRCAAASRRPRSGVHAASSTSAAPSSSSATSRIASSLCIKASAWHAVPPAMRYVARTQLAIALRKRLKRSERLHRLYLSGALRPRRNAQSS